jgi:4-hydroxy-L-threonine phosphate dehydrogenase PdxA
MTLDQLPDPETASLNERCAYYAELHRLATDLDRLARKVANLNPHAGEIGAGMLAQLVEDARRITK